MDPVTRELARGWVDDAKTFYLTSRQEDRFG